MEIVVHSSFAHTWLNIDEVSKLNFYNGCQTTDSHTSVFIYYVINISIEWIIVWSFHILKLISRHVAFHL
jgi:hypothetical protein